MTKAFVAVILAALSVSPAMAEVKSSTGGWLAEMCDRKDRASDWFCMGYAAGIADASPKGSWLCLPEQGVTYSQGQKVVKKFLADHPERLHEPAVNLVIAALAGAFPCKAPPLPSAKPSTP